MPRSALLEGTREAGGNQNLHAIAKQETAAPQGAGSFALAVLERDERKTGSWARQRGELGAGKLANTTQDAETPIRPRTGDRLGRTRELELDRQLAF